MSDSASTVRNVRRVMQPQDGFASSEVGGFVAQLDDLSRAMRERLSDITSEELEWQPASGMNTIGMLLAHLAIVEVYWMDVGIRMADRHGVREVLGIGVDGDGMPLPEDAAPPEGLAGKPFAWFQELETKARAHSKDVLHGLEDAALEEERETLVGGGTLRIRHNRRWVLYHVLEHYSGHFGQILLLRHQYRVMR